MPIDKKNGPGVRLKREAQGARDMRKTHETKNGSEPAAADAAGAQPALRCRTARPGLSRKVLSVALSVMLVATMNPLANDTAALAQTADGVQKALGSPTAADGSQEPSDGSDSSDENLGGGCLQMT